MAVLAIAAVYCIFALNIAGATKCNEQFNANLLAHDSAINIISRTAHARSEEKLAEKCSALDLLVTRVTQSECPLSSPQFVQLTLRQHDLLVNGGASCWATRPYSITSQIRHQNFASFPVNIGETLATASPRAIEAASNIIFYENTNRCDEKVRRCHLRFQSALLMRSSFQRQTCPIIEAYTNCLVALTECGFSESLRPIILRGASAQTQFRYWESKVCPLNTQGSSTPASTVSASNKHTVKITVTPVATTARADSNHVPAVAYAPNECGRTKFRCGNGKCISLGDICNVVDNCGDASDEMGCQNVDNSLAWQIDQVFIKNECYDVMSNCTSAHVTPMYLQAQAGQQLDPDKLCKASNKFFQCALHESCRLPAEDKTTVSALLVNLFERVVSRNTCQLITENVNMINFTNIFNSTNTSTNITTTTNTTPVDTPSTTIFQIAPLHTNATRSTNVVSFNNITYKCVKSCRRTRPGNYHSCQGCHVFATCASGLLYDNRPCPGTLIWDDNSKRCDVHSTTCPTSKTCVSACDGRPSGDYQSCNGCDVYVTCNNGVMLDNRPCPAKLLWNDISKSCEQFSATCEPDGGQF